MGVATKEKDLCLGFSVSCVFSCTLQLCFQAEFVFVSNADGSGDKEEGFGSRVFSFGVSYSLADSNRVFHLSLYLCLMPFFFFFFNI